MKKWRVIIDPRWPPSPYIILYYFFKFFFEPFPHKVLHFLTDLTFNRSSLSSNSEGDDIEMCSYSRGGFNQGQMIPNSNMMVSSPYMIARDTGQSVHVHQPGAGPGPVKKDDKYWERRR